MIKLLLKKKSIDELNMQGNKEIKVFSNGHSGGIGVIDSGYYIADISSIWDTFDDGFVEFWFPPDGRNAVNMDMAVPLSVLSMTDILPLDDRKESLLISTLSDGLFIAEKEE